MKKQILFFSIIFLVQSAYSITDQELTSKVMSDTKFIQAVESSIRGIFKKPSTVMLKFNSVGVQSTKAPYFYADFKYYIKVGNLQYGYCSFTMLGELKNDASPVFVKMAHQDCGE